MKKRVYAKPVLESETFVPQNYIAACGDTEYGRYKFECNAPAGGAFISHELAGTGFVGNDGVISSSSYRPCNEIHYSPLTDTYARGFIDRNKNKKEDYPDESVYIWVESRGGIPNYHATANINRESWTIVKS